MFGRLFAVVCLLGPLALLGWEYHLASIDEMVRRHPKISRRYFTDAERRCGILTWPSDYGVIPSLWYSYYSAARLENCAARFIPSDPVAVFDQVFLKRYPVRHFMLVNVTDVVLLRRAPIFRPSGELMETGLAAYCGARSFILVPSIWYYEIINTKSISWRLANAISDPRTEF